MTTTLIDTGASSAGFTERLLLPAWAQVVRITREAPGVSTSLSNSPIPVSSHVTAGNPANSTCCMCRGTAKPPSQ